MTSAGNLWMRLQKAIFRKHGSIKSFDHEVEAAGGVAGRSDIGVKTVSVEKVVGSVGRTHNLRSDFFYKTGKMTGRFISIGKAMQQGKMLPPLEVYKVKRNQNGPATPAPSEYYVVDGHHRVAMAKKLGQDFLDAHVVEYKVSGIAPSEPDGQSRTGDDHSAPIVERP